MAPRNERATVIGLGYIGLPTAALLAARGFDVTGVDINPAIVERVNAGAVHIAEPRLASVVGDVVAAGRLTASLTPAPAGVFIIATPTPITANKAADISAVEAAAHAIAPMLDPGNLVVVESTCPVGTTAAIARLLAALRPDLSFPHQVPDRADIAVAYCPERVLPGHTLEELTGNDRIVGGLDQRSGALARGFYRRFVTGDVQVTGANEAELSKLLENAYRDVNVAFANEVSLICERFGLNAQEVISFANRHPRVSILQPGTGVGGHCIPVDPWFIHEAAPDITPLIATARAVNDGKPDWVAQRILDAARACPGVPIALLGLSYKPDVDDLRGSPAVTVAQRIATHHQGDIFIADPHIAALPDALAGLPHVHLHDTHQAVAQAGIVAVLCGHSAFAALAPARLRSKHVIDPVGLFADQTLAHGTAEFTEERCARVS